MSTGGIHAPPNSRNGSQRTIAMSVLLQLMVAGPHPRDLCLRPLLGARRLLLRDLLQCCTHSSNHRDLCLRPLLGARRLLLRDLLGAARCNVLPPTTHHLPPTTYLPPTTWLSVHHFGIHDLA